MFQVLSEWSPGTQSYSACAVSVGDFTLDVLGRIFMSQAHVTMKIDVFTVTRSLTLQLYLLEAEPIQQAKEEKAPQTKVSYRCGAEESDMH